MRLKCIVSYDGTAYKGWQVQPGLITIQQVIEEVLSSVQNHKTPIVSSGRTDAGVHAVGQVFHFDSTMDITCEKWQYILNSKLPKDIRIREITEAQDTFHARFDACWKHYDYRINTGVFNPFERNYALQLCKPLDIDKMRETASIFVGTHDFTAFNKNTMEERPNQVREIYKIELKEESGVITISFFGEGFLRFMVRMLTQTMIEVGKGRLTTEEVKDLLERKEKNSAPYNATGSGLYLMEVGYESYKA